MSKLKCPKRGADIGSVLAAHAGPGYEPEEGGGGASERQEGRLAEGQAEEEARRMIRQSAHLLWNECSSGCSDRV